MPTPISPSVVTEYRPEFLPAYVANGVVGLRVPRIPQSDGLAILNTRPPRTETVLPNGRLGVHSAGNSPKPADAVLRELRAVGGPLSFFAVDAAQTLAVPRAPRVVSAAR